MGSLRNVLKAVLLPLILLFGIIGVILMLYGTIEMFTLPPKGARAAGGTAFLMDCDQFAEQASTENEKAMLKARCDAQQRPFLYLLCLAAVMTFLACILALCLVIKAPRWMLNFLTVHNAVTITLLLLSIFAMMAVLAMAQPLGQLQEQKTQAEQEGQSVNMFQEDDDGVARKPGKADAYSKQIKYLTDTVQPCFWVGVSFCLIATGLITLLTSGMWHGKGRLRDDAAAHARDYEMGYGRRPTIGERGAGHASTGRQEPYYSEAERGSRAGVGHHGPAPTV